MIGSDSDTLSGPYKILLLGIAAIFAVAIVVLIISSSWAATATGSSPYLAISLTNDLNTGILAPGEQRWFKLTPSAAQSSARVEQSLTLFFTPDNGHRIRYVSLELFEENQLPFFYQGDVGKMNNFGAGSPVSRDGNPDSGELFWTGWLFSRQNHYIQLENSSDAPIDYWLLTADISSYPLGEVEAPSEVETQPILSIDGTAPAAAIPLLFEEAESSRHTGYLDSGQNVWYSFSITDADGEYFEEVALTMFATPNQGHQAERLIFEVFTAEAVQSWSSTPGNRINNLGAGGLVQRDTDPLTTEHFWTGWIVDGDLYYVRIHNGAEGPINYWLFTGDVYHPELGMESP